MGVVIQNNRNVIGARIIDISPGVENDMIGIEMDNGAEIDIYIDADGHIHLDTD